MSDQTKEAAPDPDTAAAAVTSDAAAQEEGATSSTETRSDHGNGMAGEKVSNGAEHAEPGQEPSESALKVQKEEATIYRGESKRELGGQRDGTRNYYQKRENKSKYDPNAERVPEDPAERAQLIRNITDFYFSDSNLRDDKYLSNLIEGETNLPVKIEVIHRFNRMKKFEYTDVVAAMRDSVVLEVAGPEGLEEVKRKIPYDPNKKDVRVPRTVYVKGFGEEVPSSQFDIEAFFAQYGPTNSVRLRRSDDKFFKGSCYVEFQDEETAQSFLALDPKPLWKGKHELEIMSQEDYIKNKNRAIRDGDSVPNATRPIRGKGGRGGGFRGNRDQRDVGDRDPDDWKKRREDDQKSGFRENRRDRDNRHQNSRSGRGRGRGNDRDRRNNDRNEERANKNRTKPDNRSDDEKEESTKKRAREDDGEADEAPSKKVDQKEEVSADAS